MGLSSSTQTQTNGPSAQALPYIQAGSNALQGQYAAGQGNTSAVTNGLGSAFSGLLSNINNGNSALSSAQNYDNNLLNGSYTPSPELDGIISSTNNDVMNQINSIFSKAGQTGSSAQLGDVARNLAANESNIRNTDYQSWLARQQAAASNAAGLIGAQNNQYATLAGLGTTATTQPMLGAEMLASGLGNLWGNSQTSKTTQSPSLGSTFGSLLQAGANAASLFV